MGLMRFLFGAPGGAQALGAAVESVAEVFTPNATKTMQRAAETRAAAMAQFGEEFAHPRMGWFDALVNGLNRLPRPALALGCLGLFVYAMADPAGFSLRMQGLQSIPEPLWWLLGAVVSFYFGAREAHHFRLRPRPPAPEGFAAIGPMAAGGVSAVPSLAPLTSAQTPEQTADPGAMAAARSTLANSADNPALAEWLAGQGNGGRGG